jgi:hypothetical protein
MRQNREQGAGAAADSSRSRAIVVHAVFGLWVVGIVLPAAAIAQSTYTQTLPWNYSVGNPSSFSAYVNGQLQLSGAATGTTALAQAAAGGAILGYQKDIVKATASASAYITGDNNVDVSVKVFGISAYSYHPPPSTGPTINTEVFKKGFDVHESAKFPVGPFVVTATIGLRGTAELNYSLGLKQGGAFASLTPSVKADTYGTAGIGDGFFVEVGVGANLTLVDDKLPISWALQLTPNYFATPPAWGVKFDYDITNRLNLLSGNIFLYATLDWWFGKEEWKTTVFSWPGFQFNKTLFHDGGWISVGPPLPQLSSLSPASVLAGSGPVQLTINGAGFADTTQLSAYWDGVPITVQSGGSSTQAVVTVPGSNVSSAGQHFVTLENKGALGGTSNPLPFHVLLGAPVLTQVNPGGVTAGGNDFSLTIYGSSLIPGSSILWNSAPLPTTHISDLELTAVVPANFITTVGSAQISVRYPGAGGALSNTMTVLISDPNHPIITRTLPARAFPGSSDLTVQVVGTGFVTGSTVYWNGAPLTTTYASGVQLNVLVPASLMSAQTVAQLGVINPGGLPSNAVSFTVAPIMYTAVPIPLPPGESGTWTANHVNTNGLVAVNSPDLKFAYLWSEAGGIVSLPIQSGLPYPSCVPVLATIDGLNNLGQAVGTVGMAGAVGGTYTPGQGCPGGSHAFLYANGALSFPFPSGFGATGINDHGVVVGSNGSWPALWQAGSMQQLTGPGDPHGSSNCCSINNANQVIGNFDQFAPNQYAYTAFVWTGGSPTAIPNQFGDSMRGQNAASINDFGVVVGHGASGWLWRNGSMSAVPIWADSSGALNNNGDIVGPEFSGSAPALFSNGQSHRLNDLLANPAAGQVVAVYSIADNGLIAGTLRLPNGTVGPVLLKPNSVQSGQSAFSSSTTAAPEGFFNGSMLVMTPVTGVEPSTVPVGSVNVAVTVKGTSFVKGAIVFWNGTPLPTTFNSSTTLVATVSSTLIATTGYATITTANPGGDASNGFVIAIVNPAPTVDSVSPSSAVAGSTGFSLTISGGNFQTGSQVYWNQNPLTKTYSSPNQITVVVPDNLLRNPSIAAITVVNSAPGGGASAPLTLRINPPTPVLNNISPSSLIAGSQGFTMTLSGAGFDGSSVALWNNVALQTTYVSANTLTAQVPSSYLNVPGTPAVQVTDTISNSWPSRAIQFEIAYPSPQAASLSPTSVQAGSGDLTLKVTGAGFVDGSTVYFNSGPLPTTYVSPSQLSVAVAAGDVATATTAQIAVVNPQPSNPSQSTSLTFTVADPPRIQDITPAMARRGSGSVVITLRGSGFTRQSVATWSDSPVPTTFVSGTQLTATLPSSSLAVSGTFPIRVVQQVMGGGRSRAVSFSVNGTPPPVPAIANLSPSSIVAGADHFGLSVIGTGFISTTRGLWNGSALPTTFISPTQVIVHVPAANISSPGIATVRLQNQADDTGAGGGTSNPLDFSVLSGSASGVQIIVTRLLGRDGSGNIVAQLTLTNAGSTPASNVIVTGIKVGALSGGPLPQPLGSILPNSSTQVAVTVPASAGPAGSVNSITVTGTYTGGTFTSTARIALP